MRATQYLLTTLKEIPKNCETISHQLMLRSGMIRQISTGLYTWLPIGLRVLRKVENIVRDEMNNISFIEISMPIIQPANLWKQSGRWSEYGPELLRFKNRVNQEFVLGPTHEEMISNLICKEIISYKQFPIKLYQMNTKYRDEIRPRFGLIRAKEFTMKDGYSFHTNNKCLQNTYNNIYHQYHTIFNRIGLNFHVVQADTGNTGGTLSHEFQAYPENNNNYTDNANQTAMMIHHNQSKNLSIKHNNTTNQTQFTPTLPNEIMRLITIPPKHNNSIQSILELLNKFKLPINKTIKITIVKTNNINQKYPYNFLGLVLRADHQLDNEKLLMIPEIFFPTSILNKQEVEKIIKVKPILLNFIHLSIPIIIDRNVAIMNDFIIESNIDGKYIFGVNWNRDLPMPKIADLYKSKCNNNYKQNNKNKKNIAFIQNKIEIGHIFQLGDKYSRSIYSCIQKYNKFNIKIIMGCYGIGITRIIPTIIEQNYDQYGIIWPDSIAPFKLAIIPINMHVSVNVRNTTEELYTQFKSIIGSDVFIYDRKENPGIMFADIDLIGIPHILVISDRNLNNQEVEYKHRKTRTTTKIKLDVILQFLINKLIRC
ncbi:prolyl-tRNA synthetase [Candidatus Blochmanniella vafra str. BVAF]|uniref:Proline--tRNA ligase n=2 Tax=Candidatus Blochmanniella vafra TaxID=251535 RepID=E8Q6U3_BLOVB|nr:proline--tRNA ligase [Candidatus Blochmannia vafer]ADV33690.1 prolyl-tRNA synthetase [Candidatus Blochmannia vafer str. BVAF]